MEAEGAAEESGAVLDCIVYAASQEARDMAHHVAARQGLRIKSYPQLIYSHCERADVRKFVVLVNEIAFSPMADAFIGSFCREAAIRSASVEVAAEEDFEGNVEYAAGVMT